MYCQSYCRSRLAETMQHIRTIVSAEDIKQAWVWKCPSLSYNGQHVEFHGPNNFHWHDDGCCLWSARSDGWNAYLQHLEYQAEEEAQHTVEIPATFASDHYDRELPCGLFVSQSARTWTFKCTLVELKEWLSDARFYSDPAIVSSMRSSCGPGIVGLQSSARATVERITTLLDTLEG